MRTEGACSVHAGLAYPPRVVLAHPAAPPSGIRVAVEDAGFAVIAECRDGATATAAVVRERAELCLVDAELPDACEAVAAIASLPLAPKVVVLAPGADEQSLFAALDGGAVGYLLKDVRPSRLGEELRNVVDGGIAIAPAVAAQLVASLRRRTRGGAKAPVGLTAREWQVLELLATGLTTTEIGVRLRVSAGAVHRHVASALKRISAWGVTSP